MYQYRLIEIATKEEVLVGTSAEVAEYLNTSSSNVCTYAIQGISFDKKYIVEKFHAPYSECKLKAIVDDDYIIDRIENGGTYEELAEHYNLELKVMRQYCGDRGYTYKNRGKIRKVDTPRNYYSEFNHVCPQCKKNYSCYNPSEWGWTISYKGERLRMCSYGCMRKFEREHGMA